MKWLSRFRRSKPNSRREPVFILAIVAIVVLSIPISFQIRHADDEVRLGVSFSIKYAEELGLDWQQAFLALLDDIEVKNLRLMSYWDAGEPEPDIYDFEDLDWQIDQATRHGAEVSLAVGQRQPRWPECHVPRWAQDLESTQRNAQLLQYITEVVTRYRESASVTSYQVENEAANRLFGECDAYDSDFLNREILLVKSLHPEAQVITNTSNQSGVPTFGPVQNADKVGFSIYKNAHFEAFGAQRGWSFWYVPSQWHSLRAAIVEGFSNKQTFIHELQAEPWGPEATVNLSIEEQNKTMNKDHLVSIVEFAKQSGMKEIYLWGGEWWYWRLTEFNDKELWQTVKDVYSSSPNRPL